MKEGKCRLPEDKLSLQGRNCNKACLNMLVLGLGSASKQTESKKITSERHMQKQYMIYKYITVII